MCDHASYEALKNQVDALDQKVVGLDGRVDGLDKKVAVIDSQVTEMRQENKEGFALVRAQLQDIYGEKVAWGEWLRAHIPSFFKWLGWFIAAVCGITQIPRAASSVVEAYARMHGA